MNIFESKSLIWINEPENWNFNGGGLSVTAPPNSDFFIDEEGPSVRETAPYLYTTAAGDFSLTTRVDVEMIDTYDSACLMIMADSKNWAKICYENWLDEPAIVSVVTKGYSDDCPSYKTGDVKPYLKVLRSGNCFGFHYSLDGRNWTIIRYFNMQADDKIRVGVAAQSPVGKGCKISFEFLELEEKKINSAKTVE